MQQRHFDQAVLTHSRWLAYVQKYGLENRFADQIARARELLARSRHAASVSADHRRHTQKRPEEGFRLLRGCATPGSI